MLMIVAACLLVLGASVAFVWFLCLRAPEAYEDQTGFHQTADSESAMKSSNSIGATPIKAHNDHEPIAA